MNSFTFIIFILIFLGIEVYVYFGLKSYWKNKTSTFRKVIKSIYFTILILTLFSTISIFFFRENAGKILTSVVVGIFIINLLTKLVALPFVLIDDVRRLILFFTRSKEKKEDGISRSEFLQKAGLIAAGIPLTALSTGVVIGGAYRYKIHKKKLSFANLPESFNGLKIVQISDIHSGSFYDKAAVMRGVQMIMDEQPDIVFFTGDIVNELASEMDDYYDVFDKITAPMGVYAILGNHDYGDYYDWETDEARLDNFERVKQIHGKLGWKLLLDEHFYLEKNGDRIGVIGIENWGRGFHQFGDMAKAYKGCEAPFKILLSHDPTHWEDQVIKDYPDIDLTLSGHTHGAQMGIETHGFKWSPIKLRYNRWAGLYEEKNQKLYINRGFGFIGYPGRIGIWPEITVLELNNTA